MTWFKGISSISHFEIAYYSQSHITITCRTEMPEVLLSTLSVSFHHQPTEIHPSSPIPLIAPRCFIRLTGYSDLILARRVLQKPRSNQKKKTENSSAFEWRLVTIAEAAASGARTQARVNKIKLFSSTFSSFYTFCFDLFKRRGSLRVHVGRIRDSLCTPHFQNHFMVI